MTCDLTDLCRTWSGLCPEMTSGLCPEMTSEILSWTELYHALVDTHVHIREHAHLYLFSAPKVKTFEKVMFMHFISFIHLR